MCEVCIERSLRRRDTYEAALPKRHKSLATQDNMVTHIDAENVTRANQAFRDKVVLWARFGISGGMYVGQNDGACIHEQNRLLNLPRMHDRQVERPDADDVQADQFILDR